MAGVRLHCKLAPCEFPPERGGGGGRDVRDTPGRAQPLMGSRCSLALPVGTYLLESEARGSEAQGPSRPASVPRVES